MYGSSNTACTVDLNHTAYRSFPHSESGRTHYGAFTPFFVAIAVSYNRMLACIFRFYLERAHTDVQGSTHHIFTLSSSTLLVSTYVALCACTGGTHIYQFSVLPLFLAQMVSLRSSYRAISS